jgi:hypothetical protein
MSVLDARAETPFDRSCRWLRRWLYGVNLAVLVYAAGFALLHGSRWAPVIVAFVPIVFVPFSYARLRLHRSLGRLLARRAARGWLVAGFTSLGGVADSVTVVQLLTAWSASPPASSRCSDTSTNRWGSC